MKKILSIVLCAAAASAFAEGEPSDNEAVLGTVGVTAITTSLSNAIVAVSYDDLAGGSGIVVSNFVKTTNLTVNDQLAVFGSDGTYSTWTLKQVGDQGPKYWDKNEMTFTVDSDGKLTQGNGTASSEVTQAVGTGIWLVRQEPIAANGSTNTFYIYGKPSTSMTSNLAAGKWNLVGNPKQEAVTINGSKINGISKGDELVAPIEPAGLLCRYEYTTEEKGWRKVGKNNEWEYVSPVLQPGLGCWIRTANTASITW